MNAIETKNLTKSYNKARGIIDVNLKIEKGEVFGFIGPNGAGKSTTIRTLLSLIRPTSGSASVLGQDCTKLEPEIYNKIGYLPSEVFYYDGMKVLELLKYSESFYKNDYSKNIEILARRLELDLNKKISDLSFGNRKKVGVIQCLLHEPELIILDEPTSGLDPLMQQTFFELILEAKQKGATVFFSSHILSEVEKICDRVAIIKEGKIIKTEKISVLKENAIKHIIIETKNQVNKEAFTIKGISKLEIKKNEASFLFNGNINNVILALSKLELSNVHIAEPDLEEIFLHYYQ